MLKTLFRIFIPKFIHTALLILSIILFPLAIQIVQTGRTSTPTQADAAIVLGTSVYREQPSPVFRERINHAIDLYERGLVEYLIFTGGVGWGDVLAEAEAARDYALARGVPASHIFIETTSHDTYSNLENAQAIAVREGFKTVVIVSDPYHLHRALIISQTIGLNATVSATPTTRYRSPRTKLPFLIAETTTLARYHFSLLFGQSQGLAAAAL